MQSTSLFLLLIVAKKFIGVFLYSFIFLSRSQNGCCINLTFTLHYSFVLQASFQIGRKLTEAWLFRIFSLQAWKKKLTAKVMLFFLSENLGHLMSNLFLTFIESFHKLIGYLLLSTMLKPKGNSYGQIFTFLVINR